ncbi:MAG: hypothetical protein M3O71_30280 [Bacteroidota bacterium]|nr:hypothetical protein [Bacteroidota bacterium]
MKKRLIYLFMVAVSAFAYSSCKTSSDPTPATVTHKFVVNGTTYTQVSAADSATNIGGDVKNLNSLAVTGQSADKSAQAALIFFWKGTDKPKAGTYKVVGDVNKMTSGQVAVLIIDKLTVAKQGIYGATGLDGTSITVAISSAGKVSVTLPSIKIAGTNIDNTDPNNSVTTSVSGSISGSAGE